MNLFTTSGGEDTAHISLCLEWDLLRLADCVCLWQSAQNLGKDGYADENDARDSGFQIDEHIFYVRPYGYNPDKSRHAKESYYHYDMVCNGIRFSFSEREIMSDDSPPNARVEIGSKPLMAWGLENCWKLIKEIIEELGAKLLRHSLGRIDACVDLPGVRVDTFQIAVQKKRIVTRAKKKSIYLELDEEELAQPTQVSIYEEGIRRQGLMIGKGNFAFRAYDKLLETRHDEEKQMILRDYRYGGTMPEVASRGEFQIRRDGLRQLKIKGKNGRIVQDGIVTIDDWIKYRHHVCMYLCTSWLRMYGQDFNRNHSERLGMDDMLPAWKKLINAFECWTTDKPRSESERIDIANLVKRETPALEVEAHALWRGALGNARSALIRQGIYLDSDDPRWMQKLIVHTCIGLLDVVQVDGSLKFFRKQQETANRVEASAPFSISERDIPRRLNAFKLTLFIRELLGMESCGAGDTEQQPPADYVGR